MKDCEQEMDAATLRLNLWLTQGLVLAIAAGSSLLFYGWRATVALFAAPSLISIGWAGGIAFLIVLSSIAMERYLPKRWQDDGSVNELIFGNMPRLTTIFVCIAVGIGEEWLFRGVVQPFAGNMWTSVIFTLVHIRYIKKPLLIVTVFGTSWLLGLLFSISGSLWSPILAHSAIDLLLAFYLQYSLSKGKEEKND